MLFNFSFDQLPGTLDMFSGCCLPVGISIIDVTVLVQESHKFRLFLHLQFGALPSSCGDTFEEKKYLRWLKN